MPPTPQVVLDNVRSRILRWHSAGGPSRAAALVTIASMAAGALGPATTTLAGDDVLAGGLMATITKLTVSPNTAPGSVATLAATEAAVNGVHPAGWVQFQAGDTDIGAPVAVSSSGIATTTAAILAVAPVAASLRATFIPATHAYLASATTSAATPVAGNNGGSISITLTVPPGGSGSGGSGSGGSGSGGSTPTGDFTVTVQPGTVTLQDVGQSGVAVGALQTITVSETRDPAPGWSVRGQESDFTGKRGARPRTIAGTALGWVPAGTLAAGARLGPAVNPGNPGIGDSGPVLAAADPGSGVGTSTISAALTLLVAGSEEAGPYTGLLTITYVESGPLPASTGQPGLPPAG